MTSKKKSLGQHNGALFFSFMSGLELERLGNRRLIIPEDILNPNRKIKSRDLHYHRNC